MTITRKLRAYLAELKLKGRIKTEDYKQLRKEIRLKKFKSLSNMKERIKDLGGEK